MGNLLEVVNLFGHIAAEEEHNEIVNYFQETDVFNNIYKGQKYLVLGRKGSGKSAIFFYLQKKFAHDGTLVTTITLNNYPQAKFADLKSSDVDETEAHVQTWKFTLLLTLISLYLESGRNFGLSDPNTRKYKRFYNENSLTNMSISPWDTIKSFIQSVEQINFSALGVGAGFTRNLEKVTRTKFGLNANQINSHLQGMLCESINKHQPDGRFVILIDRLDEQWRNDTQSNALLIGLLKAARELNREIHGCRIIIFLRSDIFDQLRYQNRAHITEYIQRIEWQPSDLELVIARRIASKIGINNDGNPNFTNEMWSKVFSNIETDLYHASKGAGQKINKFFETNSFLRPRDYIRMAKCLQAHANIRGLQRIKPKDGLYLLDRFAEVDYSSEVFSEFQDELMDILPQFTSIMDVISRDLKYYRFRLQEFVSHMSNYKVLGLGDPQTVLKTLFEYSVVGIDTPGGTRSDRGPGGRGIEYKYQNDRARFDGGEYFKFHPSLRTHLKLLARKSNQSSVNASATSSKTPTKERDLPHKKDGSIQLQLFHDEHS